jgi:uncharacterized protein YecE (DUF72 family)
MAEIRIGTSGWRYGGWRSVFYPVGLPQRSELEYLAARVNSVEINGSFYSLQRPQSYRTWYEQTPADFVFAIKGSRFITHMKKLRDIEAPLANFFASGVLCLENKIGPILWQFPERIRLDLDLFRAFFDMLPRDTRAAARLARRHDERVSGRSFLSPKTKRPLRYAVEFRSQTFCCRNFIDLLRKHGIALVVADTAGRWPLCEDVTADFVYLRLHGDVELYASGYSDQALDDWARRIRAWAAGREPRGARKVTKTRIESKPRDVYVYFDNDAKVHAPFDALSLRQKLEPRHVRKAS